jgi:uncharacterized protein
VKDLAAKLRAIVQQDSGSPRVRELTYVPDLRAPEQDLGQTADRLGGAVHREGSSACVVIDHVYEPDDWHGRRRVGSYVIDSGAPVAFFDRRLAPVSDWASRVVFFDIETTGLSGGAGTLPLLAACGWFEDAAFRVRQFFLNGPAGEHALLGALAAILDEASLLVTYNGRTFDVPVMEVRWAFHRQETASDGVPHLDMLPTARRLWAHRDAELSSCTLSALERSVLRFHRFDDVPGIEIPSRYFQFLRTGDPAVIRGVFDHNRHDIISLAALTSHALWLTMEGPDACEQPGEQLGLGRIYEVNGDVVRAERAYEMAAASGDPNVAPQALARLAEMLRRGARYDDAAAAWQALLAMPLRRRADDALKRRAVEALAIHHEHRARDLATAKTYATELRAAAAGMVRTENAERRLGRLNRKLKSVEQRRGGLLG